MQAVILAAGQGKRIRDYHAMPKGFIEINDTPLICNSLEILRSYGIKDIVLVTGYKSESYVELAKKTGWFKTIYNPHYATYGNLYSLYVAKEWAKEDLCIVESDIIYESRAIEELLSVKKENVILTSGLSQSGDEVYVALNQDDELVDMSKTKSKLNEQQIKGEYVGIARLGVKACQCLFKLCEQDAQLLQHGYYDEAGFVRLLRYHPIYCHFVADLQWAEIDDINQLQQARQLFLRSSSSETIT